MNSSRLSGNHYRTRSVAHTQPRIYSQPGSQKPNRVLILLVEEVVSTSKNSDVLVDKVVRGKVDHRIGWCVQPWNERCRIAVHIDPRTDPHKRRGNREFV